MVRRSKENILEILASLPWWASVVVATVVWLSLYVVVPSITSGNPMLVGLGLGTRNIAGFAFVFFLLPIPFALFNAYRKRQLVDAQRDVSTLRALSWQEFEELIAEAYRRLGYEVESLGGSAPDGGIDLVLREEGKKTVVQCKHWQSQLVGVTLIRELFGVMTAESADACVLVTSGNFSLDSRAFARGKPIELVDGKALLELLRLVQPRPTGEIVTAAMPLPESPLCPLCGSAMLRRIARKGANAGGEFLGCSQYPRCRGTRPH